MADSVAGLENVQLLARLRELVSRGNAVEADLLAHLGEVDARRLYLEEGCSSMFVYCQQVLNFAEGVAYKRIQAARAARFHPEILEEVRFGRLHLTAVCLLAPKLTKENSAELIQLARLQSADKIRRCLANREPKPAVPTIVRRVSDTRQTLDRPVLPVRSMPTSPEPPPIAAQAKTEPLGSERYRVQFMADREMHAQLEELRALMRHQVPDGDVGKILARAVAALLAQVRKRKFAETSSLGRPACGPPKATPSRHIPAAIRRAVWKRDSGQCTFTSASGRRCNAREFVEFDHVDGWWRTKEHSAATITLRCRAHNQYRARIDLGESHMAKFTRRSSHSTGFESSSVQ